MTTETNQNVAVEGMIGELERLDKEQHDLRIALRASEFQEIAICRELNYLVHNVRPGTVVEITRGGPWPEQVGRRYKFTQVGGAFDRERQPGGMAIRQTAGGWGKREFRMSYFEYKIIEEEA